MAGAGTWVTVAFMLTSINIMMYIGMGETNTFLFNGDLLSDYFNTNMENNETNLLNPASNYTLNLTTSASASPTETPLTSIPGVSVIGAFLDALQIALDFIKTVFNIVFAPLTLFKLSNIPYFITILIAFPMTMLYLLSIWQFVRGAS